VEQEWIDCKKELPPDKEEVEIIAFVYEPCSEWDGDHSYQRIIATAQFDASKGWWVRTGFIINRMTSHERDRFLSWGGVIYWRLFSKETKKLFEERKAPL
jgi:hypothetical protein